MAHLSGAGRLRYVHFLMQRVVNSEALHDRDDVTALPREIVCVGPFVALAGSSPRRQAKAVTMDPRTFGAGPGAAVATEERTS
jgi:hypothetical protein